MGADGTERPAAVRAAGRFGRVLVGGAGLTVRGLTRLVAPSPARESRPEGGPAGPAGAIGQTADGPAVPPPPPPPERPETEATVVAAAGRLGEAALGLAALTSRRALDVAAGVAMPVEAAASIVVRAGAVVAGRTGMARRVDRLARIGREEQRRNEREAALLFRSAWRRSVVGAVAATDVGAVLDEVDVDGIVRRVDLDGVVGSVDLNAVVSRVDLDAVVERVDLDAVIVRLRVPELVERVLDDIDLGRIVRESSAGMAAETVDAVRVRSAGADRALNGFVDRVVLRRRPRDSGRVTDARDRNGAIGEEPPAGGAVGDQTAADGAEGDGTGRAPP
ncbi:hypothetical protein [Jiangella muralis]|uniref:hypothetical protein n=1 Tax=Jiangella muralis TaxID=702383 RepID=UPI00069FD8B0|nr:hypothetical protein [Jiangella muralis]